MTPSASTPASDIFPGFPLLYDLVYEEIKDLSPEQLDWASDNWTWSAWSIRRQVSHIPSFISGWLLDRWGDKLFPTGTRSLGRTGFFIHSKTGSWLDETEYPDISLILAKLQDSLDLVAHVLSRETYGSMRTEEAQRPDTPPHWTQFIKAHPTGVRWHPTEPNFTYISLEATFRHLYYETLTHLYNIQRLKRAQGLTHVSTIPPVGYWMLPDWDRSEP